MQQDEPRVAILYQAVPPPVFDGVSKPLKPGGYSDSGADIGFGLQSQEIKVITPNDKANPSGDVTSKECAQRSWREQVGP